MTIDKLSNFINQLDDYFVSAYISQGEFAKKLNPSSLNSMRIVTMIDPITNEAFVPVAVQRIGTEKSSPADNWTQGGICAEIDIETGKIKKGVSYPVNGMLNWYKYHPDNNNQIEGITIPGWDRLKESILRVANQHPYIKYIGWDVVLTDSGIEVIEGNNCTDTNLLQVHRPLLKDKRVIGFYRYYGIIK